MRNARRDMRSSSAVKLLVALGLSATCLFGWTACDNWPPTIPEPELGPEMGEPLRAFTAFLSTDRSVLVRGDSEAGIATLRVTTNLDGLFAWTLDPADLLDVDPTTPIVTDEPGTTTALKLTGVRRDPGAQGTTVRVTVAITEWLCEVCVDEAGEPLADENGAPLWCFNDEPVVDVAECEGEPLERTLTLEVRRPEAPLTVSLVAVEGTSMQPAGEKRVRVLVSAGRPFAEEGGECDVPVGAIEPADDTNGKPYCVSWRVVENVSPSPDVRLSERLSVSALRSGDVAQQEDEADTIAEAVYEAPAANGSVTFQVTVVDAAGPSIQREVTVDILSQGTEAVALEAGADHPDLCTGETTTITAKADGGTGDNTFTFSLVGGALAGETLTVSGAQATYKAPTGQAVTRTIRVTVSEAGGSSAQTNVVITTITSGSCDDANACTGDTCSFGTCGHANVSGSCDDKNACTTGDSCSNGTCAGTGISCDDGKVCTNDFCESASGCQHLNNTNPCDDGNACTTGDVCSGGSCSSGAPRNCDDGNPCTDDSCSPATGCHNANNVAGCTDGLFCNGNDTCAGGTCSVHVGDPCTLPELCSEALDACVECLNSAGCDDTTVCTDDECVAGSCVYTNNTVACDDGLHCNGTDTCAGGSCSVHVGDPCTAPDVCDEAGDACVECVTPAHCDDGNVCTTDACVASACQHTNNADGCNDGVFCNGADTCGGGTCSVHVGDPCTLPDLCNETTDACVQCLTTADCNDGNVCTSDACVAGSCIHTPNAAACDDGLYCNGVDTCSSGLCSAHAGDPCTPDLCLEASDTCAECLTAADCDDANVCTDDACVVGACQYTNNAGPCDDGLFCTGMDTCAGGTCSAHVGDPCTPPDLCSEALDACVECLTAADCNDGNVCTTDACVTGSCINVPNTKPCNDAVFCNGADTCAGGTCSAHAGDPCTLPDLCSEALDACVECLAAGDCDDAEVCTDDACVAGVCQYANNAGACSDGLFCNGADACAGGTCSVHAGDPCTLPNLCSEALDACVECLAAGDCDDAEVCTDDACVAGVCQYTNNAGACDDGLFCNGADTCAGGTCSVHAGDPCPGPDGDGDCAESCREPSDDCTANDPNGSGCDDGLYCNENETCAGGHCGGGSALDCGDSLTCTTDACNEGTDSCDNDLEATSCLIGGLCYGDLNPNPANECEQCDVSSDQGNWSDLGNGSPCTTCAIPPCVCSLGVCVDD